MENKMNGDLRSPLLNWIEQFIGSIPQLAKDTRVLYKYTVLRFVVYWEKIEGSRKCWPVTVKQETIAKWLKRVNANGFPSTVVLQAGILNRFLSFLKKNGILRENPLVQLQKRYPKRGLKGIALALISSCPCKSLNSLQVAPRFVSPLGPHMQRFIALSRSQGKIYRAEEYILSRFDRFLISYPEPPGKLSDPIVSKWLGIFSKSRPEHQYKNFKVIRVFCLYLRRLNPEVYVPDKRLCSSPGPPFIPYIYSRAEVVKLIKAARELKPTVRSPLRPQILYIIILLLYTTGMRLGEALELQIRDIDSKEQALCIREAKFFKSRIVPLSSSMMTELEAYLQLRVQSGMPTHSKSPIFQGPCRGKPYSISTIQGLWRGMLRDLGLKPVGSRSGPRPHDLRATFAVHRLEEWYSKGEDVQSKLGLLSVYLGHIGIASTQRYLPMTTELLQQASQRFKRYFTSTTKEENDER